MIASTTPTTLPAAPARVIPAAPPAAHRVARNDE
jgi:hypothetical protein